MKESKKETMLREKEEEENKGKEESKLGVQRQTGFICEFLPVCWGQKVADERLQHKMT